MSKKILITLLATFFVVMGVYAFEFEGTPEEWNKLNFNQDKDLKGLYNPVSLDPTSGDLDVTGDTTVVDLTATGDTVVVDLEVGGSATTKVLNEIRHADQFAGSDIGAKVNAAYADLSSQGGEIVVSTSSSFSTPMDFSTANKTVLLRCLEGVTLTYTGVGTSTTFNLNKSHTTYGWGMNGCNLVGPDPLGTTTGISVGGTNGGEGFKMINSDVTRFGLGIGIGDNTWMFTIDKSAFHWDGQEFASFCTANCGEQWTINDSVFFDSQDASGYNATSCVDVGSNIASVSFNDSSFDDCGVVLGAGTAGSFNDCHFEDPAMMNVPYYHYVTLEDSIFTSANFSGGYFLRNSTSTGANRFVHNGGTITMVGTTFDKSTDATAVNRAVHNVGSYGTAKILGGYSKKSALTSWINGVEPLAGSNTQTIDMVTANLAGWPMGINQTAGNVITFTNGGGVVMDIESTGVVTFATSSIWKSPDGTESYCGPNDSDQWACTGL